MKVFILETMDTLVPWVPALFIVKLLLGIVIPMNFFWSSEVDLIGVAGAALYVKCKQISRLP